MTHMYASELADWFLSIGRDFPWRRDRTPYRVLVSEIMLQQTRAVAVLPFYNRWMDRFPDFLTLSTAPELEVMKFWEGLGYYSRARNLKAIAIRVVEEFGGEFPSGYKDILSFKGIGPYTAAAVSLLAFNKRAVGADGNIIRVIARFYGYTQRVDTGKGVLPLLDQFLPPTKSHVPFEALIELGATMCTKKPKCMECPLRGGCRAFSEELTDVIPVVKKRPKTEILLRTVFIIETEKGVIVKKELKKLMHGLYEFPYLDVELSSGVVKRMEERFSCTLIKIKEHKKVAHFFTKYKAILTPVFFAVSGSYTLPEGYEVISKKDLEKYPFSSGHKKILLTI